MTLAQQRMSVPAALQQAMVLARNGQLAAAEQMLGKLLCVLPQQPDALQLLGMVARQQGDHARAIDLFQQSLAASPRQPHVLNNLGNSLTDANRQEEAITAYRAALQLQPSFPDAQVNLALALIRMREPEEARDLLTHVTVRHPQDARAHAALGQAYQAMARYDDAIASFGRSLALRVGDVPTLHNLAVTLRLTGRPAEAVNLLRACERASPDLPEIHYNLGHCLQDLGDVDGATAAYERAIVLQPGRRELHDSLNRMLWAHGRHERHLLSYRRALAADPQNTGILADLAHRLSLGGHHEEAAALLTSAAAHAGAPAEIHYRLGQAVWGSGRNDAALAHYRAATSADPSFAPAARELARTLIILDRPREALAAIEPALSRDPVDQQALALQGLAWRFIGDGRHAWLNDTDRLIHAEVLIPQVGDIAGFNRQLDAALDPLHGARQAPLEQTMRGGTQTTDDLFGRPIPEVASVRAMIGKAVTRYLANLPADAGHPFTARARADFAVSGSWSVRLHDSGFHENHIHPEGWISACYYVAVPDAVDDDHQGWLKFGESGLRLGEREQIARVIRPEPGLLVLFPSYFYHGTVPFRSGQHRTTIAFDLMPA